MNAQQPWRAGVGETWVRVGQKVRDGFGDWWIVAVPSDDIPYGYAQVSVGEAPDAKRGRHIYVCEFVRDFVPVD